MTDGAGSGQARLRVLLAISDRERERAMAGELAQLGLEVTARALDAPSLVEYGPGDSDVALVSSDLHQLTPASLAAVQERRLPAVLLAHEADEVERYTGLALVLPARSTGEAVARALRDAVRLGPPYGTRTGAKPGHEPQEEAPVRERRGTVVAVTSGKGAPGKTTVTISLAAAMANRDEQVVLVDADLRGGNVAPYLDLDPRRGMVALASAERGPARQRLHDELQDGPGFAVLAGLERPGLGGELRAESLLAVVAALRDEFAVAVVDLGSYSTGSPVEPVLRSAEVPLLVTGADLVSVWNAQVAVKAMREGGVGRADALRALINRHEGREQYGATDVERALGLPVLGVVREDRGAARRAVDAQLPLSATGGKAARDLRALVARLADHEERAIVRPRRRWWWLPLRREAGGVVR